MIGRVWFLARIQFREWQRAWHRNRWRRRRIMRALAREKRLAWRPQPITHIELPVMMQNQHAAMKCAWNNAPTNMHAQNALLQNQLQNSLSAQAVNQALNGENHYYDAANHRWLSIPQYTPWES